MKHCLNLLTICIAGAGAAFGAESIPALGHPSSSTQSRLSNPAEIAKDKDIAIPAEENVKSVQKTKMNVGSHGVTLKGYDPVAYFTLHQAVKGKESIRSSFGGAIYYFASASNKSVFDKNPSRYVPQYGAHCANYVRKGELREINPTVFFIYKGKLYVCSAADEAKEFRKNIDENINNADRNWRQLTGS